MHKIIQVMLRGLANRRYKAPQSSLRLQRCTVPFVLIAFCRALSMFIIRTAHFLYTHTLYRGKATAFRTQLRCNNETGTALYEYMRTVLCVA